MTIAAVSNGSTVWMGGDAANDTFDPGTPLIQASPKVIKAGSAVVGSDDPRLIQLLQFQVKPTGPGDTDSMEWIVTVLIPSIDEAIGEQPEYRRGEFMVGSAGQIFSVDHGRSVMKSIFPYRAEHGHDAHISTGALAALADEKPEDRIKMALAIAEEHGRTRAPFVVVSTE